MNKLAWKCGNSARCDIERSEPTDSPALGRGTGVGGVQFAFAHFHLRGWRSRSCALSKSFVAGIIALLMLASVSACHKEGPAEQAGKDLDKAVDNAGQHIEKAGDKIQDAAKGDNKDNK